MSKQPPLPDKASCEGCQQDYPEEIAADTPEGDQEVADDWYRWQPGVDSDYKYVCVDCLWDGNVEAEWTTPPGFVKETWGNDYSQFTVVEVPVADGWQRGAIVERSDDTDDLLVEFPDKSTVATTRGAVRRVWCLSRGGEENAKMYEFSGVEEYLRRVENVEIGIGDEVVVADGVIDPAVRAKLVEGFNVVAAGPHQDFHPFSDNMVLDLVHPSLYCLVKGVSRKVDGEVVEKTAADEKRVRTHGYFRATGAVGFFGRALETSLYQWLPSEFEIATDGTAKAASYINGYGDRAAEPWTSLYDATEKAFAAMVPHFQQCLTQLYAAKDVTRDAELKGKTVQVITKVVNYILQPGQSYHGVWHVEGMSHEHIIASGIYYYETSEGVQDNGLSFRRGLHENEEESIVMAYRHEEPPPFDYSKAVIDLGTIETPQNRVLVFPNSHQHKVKSILVPESSDVPGVRKIICFFLVDPEHRVTSTADIPDQRAWMSREDAEKHRIELMRDRKYYKDEMNRDIEREINLCEH
eukprot:m.214080 g.214080  ORF g.214080 m.214080 type:complete len:523 (-) comp18617_c0_seq3:3901-5469(-)